MRVILVAGGSGGHIYPCLELAKYFKSKGEEVLLAGSSNSLEEKIYKENNFDFFGVDINKKKISSHFKNNKIIKEKYKRFKPDALILFGNYISVSFGIVAILNNIPIYLHEQNVIYGNANKLLGIKAKRIYLSLPLIKDRYSKKSVIVGNPKSDVSITKQTLNGNEYNVIIAMGSLGSTTINNLLKEFISKANNRKVHYHLIVGHKYYEKFINEVAMKDNIHIYPYLENLSSYVKSCDLFVSRAGATTISEILVNGVASILIPSPYVKNNHQYLNAKYLLDNNACILLEEKKLNPDILNDEINNLIDDTHKRISIKVNAKKLAILDSKKKIYEDIKNEYK